MTVQDPEAPGRQHEQPGSREEYSHQGDRELALGPRESRRDEVDQQRRGEHAAEDQDTHDEPEEPSDGAGHPTGLVTASLGEEAGVDGNEGGGKRPFAKQVLKEVRNPEGGGVGVGRVGDAQVVGEDPLTDQARDAAEEDAGADQEGRGP